jgi:hypothetical protein
MKYIPGFSKKNYEFHHQYGSSTVHGLHNIITTATHGMHNEWTTTVLTIHFLTSLRRFNSGWY